VLGREIISTLQNHACDPDVDANQASFVTIIANMLSKKS
jgi:hypothetical protein